MSVPTDLYQQMPLLGPSIYLRPPAPQDQAQVIAVNQASAEFHYNWVSPPTTPEQFDAYLERSRRPDTVCLLVFRRADDAVMGAVNLSQLFYGPFQNAYMGYYIGAEYTGRGYMREAVGLVLDYAFGPLQLHRVEANIQPENSASIALVRRLGFTREGYSRRYLQVRGEWRDHERWAILVEDWQTLRGELLPG